MRIPRKFSINHFIIIVLYFINIIKNTILKEDYLLYKGKIMKTLRILSVLFFMYPLAALAEEEDPAGKQLSGRYHIGGKTLAGGPDNEPQDTHYYINLEGESAKDLYKAMRVKPKFDFCTSAMQKRQGGISCIEMDLEENGDKDYECWFGIEINKQKITDGVIC